MKYLENRVVLDLGLTLFFELALRAVRDCVLVVSELMLADMALKAESHLPSFVDPDLLCQVVQ
jgi:hypothetical protein